MKVTRTSGMPLENEDIPKYQAELEAGYAAIKAELGDFTKLTQTQQAEFGKRFDEMMEETKKKYKFQADWDFETVFKSKSKFKELVNAYGLIAFARAGEDKRIQCFVIDSKI
jgi:ribonuclease HII